MRRGQAVIPEQALGHVVFLAAIELVEHRIQPAEGGGVLSIPETLEPLHQRRVRRASVAADDDGAPRRDRQPVQLEIDEGIQLKGAPEEAVRLLQLGSAVGWNSIALCFLPKLGPAGEWEERQPQGGGGKLWRRSGGPPERSGPGI